MESHKHSPATVQKQSLDSTIVCQVCACGFSKRSALNRHIDTVHNDRRTYQCSNCLKTFSRKDTLQRHLSVHDKSGYYTCLECGKSFRQDFLQSHLRAATNIDCLRAYNSLTECATDKSTHVAGHRPQAINGPGAINDSVNSFKGTDGPILMLPEQYIQSHNTFGSINTASVATEAPTVELNDIHDPTDSLDWENLFQLESDLVAQMDQWWDTVKASAHIWHDPLSQSS